MAENEGPRILKQDVLGRVTTPAEQREALLDAFEASGMSGMAFAEQAGLKYQTFATWVQKRRRVRGDYERLKQPVKVRPKRASRSGPTQVRFLEAVVAAVVS